MNSMPVKVAAVVMAIVLGAISHVKATECLYDYDATVAQIRADGLPIHELTEQELANAMANVPVPITRAFTVQTKDGVFLLGIETDGCLQTPIVFGGPLHTRQLSGSDGKGNIGA